MLKTFSYFFHWHPSHAKSCKLWKAGPSHAKSCTLWKAGKRFSSQDLNGRNTVITADVIKQVVTDLKMKMETGYTTIMTQCPKALRAQSSSHNHLYINTTSGHFVCEKCNKEGSWQDLHDNLTHIKSQRRRSTFVCFKDVENVKPYIQENHQARDIWNSHIPVGHLQKDVAFRVLESFGLEYLSTSVLDQFNVRCDPKKLSLVYPVIVNNTVTGVKRLTCHSSSDEFVGPIKETVLPRIGYGGIFGLDIVPPNATEVILTGSEKDAMAVSQETKKAAIALPRGLASLPQEVLPSLERFKTIILWFGDDVRAWETAKLFAKKLNSKRCNIIRPSVDEPGPSTALTHGLKLCNILNKSRPISHKSIVSFSYLRHEVLSQLIHLDQVAGVKWKRYPTLNRLLKGHRRGELTVFTGPTGSGKTTFISDYSLDLCMQGVNTLWGSFEINNVRLCKMMLTQFAQQNIAKKMDMFDYYADHFQLLPMFFMTFHGQESMKNVIDAMTHAVYVHDIAHVIVDNLQFMMGSGGSDFSDRFMKQDSMIASFRKFATNMNCHVTLVIHPRKEKESEDLTTSSVFGTAKATQEADNVLILQDKRLTSMRGRKYLQITKNRFDGELGLMLLKFDKETLSFATKEKEKEKQRKKTEAGSEVLEDAGNEVLEDTGNDKVEEERESIPLVMKSVDDVGKREEEEEESVPLVNESVDEVRKRVEESVDDEENDDEEEEDEL